MCRRNVLITVWLLYSLGMAVLAVAHAHLNAGPL